MNSVKSLLISGCLLVSFCSSVCAANLPFGSPPQSGSIDTQTDSDVWTFAANISDVVDFTLVVTSGNLVLKAVLYDSAGNAIASNYSGSPYGCGGSTLKLSTVMLPKSDSYTLLVSDCSNTNTGQYLVYAQRTNNPAGAVPLPFGGTSVGTIDSTADSDTYTFNANANADFVLTMTTTSGSLVPKIRLYNSTGKLIASNYSGSPYGCGGSTVPLNFTVPATGRYTLLVGDCGDKNTGTYDIYVQITDSPTGAVGLLFGGTPKPGSIDKVAESDTYTFTANANDIVEFTMAVTSGSLVLKIRLFDSTGKQIASNYSGSPYGCGGSTLEMNTGPLAAGTYTVLVADCSETKVGAYLIYAQRTNKPAGAVSLVFGSQTQRGLINSAAESDTYTFSANKGGVIEFTMAVSSGSLVLKTRLYDPTGKLIASNYSGSPYGCGGSTLEMNTGPLPSAGTYTLLVGDCPDRNSGNYVIYAQRIKAPVGPVPLVWGEVQPGEILSATESDTYTFNGTANDSINLTMATTSGNLIPKMRLYRPDSTDGRPFAANYAGSPYGCGGTTVQLNSIKLPASGMYTLLVGDCSDTRIGKYNLSSQCFGACLGNPTPAPVFSPAGGTYASALTVTITTTTPGGKIYCTTDGTTPTPSLPVCPASITVSSTTTIKAIAVAPGYTPSAVVSATYTIQPVLPPPVFARAAGTYGAVQYVKVTDATAGAIIHYTTNGTAPTCSSTTYTGPIRVTAAMTIKAIACRTGYTKSAVAAASYAIIGSPSALADQATLIGTSTATLNGIVNTLGLPGSYFFEYGTSCTALSTRTAAVALASTAPVLVSTPIVGLRTKTNYCYQVKVTTAGGSATGAVLNFTTN